MNWQWHHLSNLYENEILPIKEKDTVKKDTGRDLPGFQGPNHASLLSKSMRKHELSSHLEASLLPFQEKIKISLEIKGAMIH